MTRPEYEVWKDERERKARPPTPWGAYAKVAAAGALFFAALLALWVWSP